MRIGIFTDTFPPDINGVASSTYILFQELKKHGHDVFVVAPHKGAGLSKWDENHEILYLSGIELKWLYGYTMTQPFHLNAENEIRKLNLDIIHAQQEFGVGIFARICARQLGIPLVSTYHTTYEDYTHYANPLNLDAVDTAARKLVSKLSKVYCDSALAVISPSEKTKELLLSYGVNSDIRVIPTGLPLDKFDPSGYTEERKKEIRDEFGISMDEKVILYVGRIAEEKSLDLLIRCFAEARARDIHVRFLVVGGGPDEEKLQEMARELHVEDMINFAGKRPSDTIADYYRAADAFISASLTETQGLTFIEALASGLPLFARRDEVLEELLIEGNTGWYFKDEEEFCEKLKVFLGLSTTETTEMKQRCLNHAHPYSSEVFYEQVYSLYQEVTENYYHAYVLEEIKAKDTYVLLILKSQAKEKKEIRLSIDDYYTSGLHVGDRISQRNLDELIAKEKMVNAYQRCVRRISMKDRTEKEMRDWLKENSDCTEEEVEELLQKLKDNHLIDDRRYAEEYISQMRTSLYGSERIRRDLTQKGIAAEKIQAMLEDNFDESTNAISYAGKILHTVKNESDRMKKEKLVIKLIQRGYPSGIAREAVNQLDLTEEDTEEDNLRKCAEKAYRRYSGRYTGKELKNRVFRYCFSKGYPSERINAVLEEMEFMQDD
ncbi:MAG: RecX family transcriptional regulator [Solobacterium sp.]|nr:RecX family transcriptional regulator [Solobacterium sp.]